MSNKYVFFGTDEFAIIILEKLKEAHMLPALIVATPDKPQGRGHILTPPPVKEWALENDLDIIQPEKLDQEELDILFNTEWDLFVVASYGKIIPKNVLEIPKYKTLNVHPSLLPKFRGASPIESTILADDRHTGVTIMQMDEKMDHGPVVMQASIVPEEWPLSAEALHQLLAEVGGDVLVETIPDWIKGELTPEPQDDSLATYTKKIKKDDAKINFEDDPYQNLLKICAYEMWPGAFFFTERHGKEIRVRITDAELENGKLAIKRVVPEGKKEMDYQDFLRG